MSVNKEEKIAECVEWSKKAAWVVDSHTGGEPTRVVIDGRLELGPGPMSERRDAFRARWDRLRSALVCEPRGSEALVGAYLTEAISPDAIAGVLFFNNVGVLGMCGHGLIGVVETLRYLDRIGPGAHRLDTPVGPVEFELLEDGRVAFENVVCYRKARDIEVTTPTLGAVSGDVAWGGNWFYLVHQHEETLTLSNLARLKTVASELRRAINEAGFPEVDHVELLGAPLGEGANARNFTLCPGGEYDRSPCGTGTSASVACLAAEGKLNEGAHWVLESVLGSAFTARFRWEDKEKGLVRPTIEGRAFVTAESKLVFAREDPLVAGFSVEGA